MHGENDFIDIFKNLDRYKSENNFIRLLKYACRTLELVIECQNFL